MKSARDLAAGEYFRKAAIKGSLVEVMMIGGGYRACLLYGIYFNGVLMACALFLWVGCLCTWYNVVP